MKRWKIWKRMAAGIACIPFILLALVILFEIVGMIVNHAANARQTKDVIKIMEEELTSAEIVDYYTETGNSSGTGNHVDMLTVVVFTTEDSLTEIEHKLKEYYELDEWSFWIADIEGVDDPQERYSFLYRYLKNFALPEDTSNCYLLYLNESAPFSDNLEGH